MSLHATSVNLLSNDIIYTHKVDNEIDSDVNTTFLRRAENLLQSNLYEDAIPNYAEALKVFNKGGQKDLLLKIRIRLAQCHLLIGDFMSANKMLNSLTDELSSEAALAPSEEIAHIFYLKAFTDRVLKHHSNAILTLESFFENHPLAAFQRRDQLRLELALNLYATKDYTPAKVLLKQVSDEAVDQKTVYLAQLQLARIEISQKQYYASEKRLADLAIDQDLFPEIFTEFVFLRGYTASQLHQYEEAAGYFEELHRHLQTPSIQLQLARIYLALMVDARQGEEKQKNYGTKASKLLQSIYKQEPTDQNALHLARCKVLSGLHWNDETALNEAKHILEPNERYKSENIHVQSLLLRSQITNSYQERSRFLETLIKLDNLTPSNQGLGWYYSGLNHYNEGCRLNKLGKTIDAQTAFTEAACALEKSCNLFKTCGHHLRRPALINLCQTSCLLEDAEQLKNAHIKLQMALKENPSEKDISELHYMSAMIAIKLNEIAKENHLIKEAESSLLHIKNHPHESTITTQSLKLLGSIYYLHNNYEKAQEIFTELVQKYPESPLAAEALYWSARSIEEMTGDMNTTKNTYQKVYELYPESKLAPEAYFRCYSCQDYLQGERTPIKHLQNFDERFQNNPYQINVHFILGLDAKRDRKTPEGKWISKKNLSKAIDHFYKAEQTYEKLMANQQIPKDQQKAYKQISHRAKLERALANLAIAEESQGTKRQIYLDYAEDVFKSILAPFAEVTSFLAPASLDLEDYSDIIEESYTGLAQTYQKAGTFQAAQQVYREMIEKYRQSKITRGYYLSRAWYNLGIIAMDEKNYSSALDFFQQADEAAKGRIISTDQKLELWIQTSECYKSLHQLDKAMSLLSKVINEDAVSGLRLKAMYLRSEIYELQERFELAKRQLEATAKKGGEWGKKAKEKLEQNYGYR